MLTRSYKLLSFSCNMTFSDKNAIIAQNIDCGYVSSRNHLRTKVSPDLHLTYSKNGESGVGIKG